MSYNYYNKSYTLVGYAGKSGKVMTYKKVGEGKDKFNPGRTRAHLNSMDGNLDFWVDSSKLVSAPISKTSYSNHNNKRGCSCGDEDCCSPCYCDRSCNCRGGNIYDC